MKIYKPILTSHQIGGPICEALNLNLDLIKELHIHVVTGEAVTIDTIQCIYDESGNKLSEIFKQYNLVEKDVENNEEDRRNCAN